MQNKDTETHSVWYILDRLVLGDCVMRLALGRDLNKAMEWVTWHRGWWVPWLSWTTVSECVKRRLDHMILKVPFLEKNCLVSNCLHFQDWTSKCFPLLLGEQKMWLLFIKGSEAHRAEFYLKTKLKPDKLVTKEWSLQWRTIVLSPNTVYFGNKVPLGS